MKNLLTEDVIRTKHKIFQHFRCPYNPRAFPGKLFFFQGKRIKITSDETIKTIVFDKDGQTIYMVARSYSKKTLTRQHYLEKSKQVEEYFEKWQGYRYVKGSQIYFGDFHNFDKKGQGYEIKVEAVNEDTPFYQHLRNKKIDSLISFYQGTFTNNIRQSKGQQKVLVSYFDKENKLVCTTKGVYKIGCQQGYHQSLSYLGNLMQKTQIFFINGCIETIPSTQDKQTVSRKFKEDSEDSTTHFSITLTSKTIASLKNGQWLNPQVIDYFFRRLQFAYECQIMKQKKNIKFLPTSFFEKLISSQIFSNMNKKISYQNVQYLFQPFDKLVFFFQIYELVLFPLNRDTHHFCLGAIKSRFIRNKQTKKLQEVQIQVYQLDSLYQDQVLRKRIFQLLAKCLEYANPSQKNIIGDAIEKAKKQVITTAKLKATTQQNGYDCGVFVCMYGYLLHKSLYLSSEEISWVFKQSTITSIRKFLYDCVQYKYGDFILRLEEAIKAKQQVPILKPHKPTVIRNK